MLRNTLVYISEDVLEQDYVAVENLAEVLAILCGEESDS
jgi:hypothetical protein